jgi:hypothetical protein
VKLRIALRAVFAALLAAGASAQDRGPATNPAITQSEEELEEVTVTGYESLGNREDIIIWLRRLAGRFRNEGTVEIGSTTYPVQGMMACNGVGTGPGMNCALKLEAPGNETGMHAGVFIVAVDLETPRVRYTWVDDTGVAVGTTGELRGDTAIFRTPCKASIVGTCTSTTRISAARRSDIVRLRVEIKMDGKVTALYDVNQVRMK